MQYAQLYVNDIKLDLPTDSLVALSYAVNTLADLQTVQGNISNSISLPDTANNRAALGYPEDLNFNGAYIIRKKLPCRYVQNGVDVIPQGNLRIVGASKGVLKVVVSCGNTDFFDLLTGKIRDLDMSEYDHIWNLDNVIASRLNTDGYLYPVVNYGNLINDTTKENGTAIFARDMRPAVFAKTIVDKIVASAGYTLTNLITADPVTAPIYNNLLLPFSDDQLIHPQRYIDLYSPQDIEVQNSNTVQFISANGTQNAIPFDTKVADVANRFDGVNWTANRIMRIDVSATFPHIHLSRPGGSGGSDDSVKGAYFKIMVRAAADGSTRELYEAQSLGFSGGSNDADYYGFTMSLTAVPLNVGDQIYLDVETAGHGVNTTVDIYSGAVLTIKANNEDVLYGEQIQIEGALPDMATTDFLKFISFMFCAIIQTDNVNQTVTIVPFGYIKQNLPNALDWSSKITNDSEDYDVQLGDYCQQNEAKWQHDDTVSPDTYANGSFYLTDDNLDLYQDIYDLPFAASMETTWLNNTFRTIFINKIPDITTANQMVTQTEQRVCLLNKTSGQITYKNANGDAGTLVGDNIPLTYFSSGSPFVPDLTLPSIFTNHYPDLVTVLSDQRKLTCTLRLTEMDIQTLDFFKPVYIQKFGCYFYISKITDFTGVKPVQVELIRL
jgi:hypothetical protein